MTITVPKAKLIAIVAIVGLLIPAGAYAAHTFPDTPDGAFYHEPVEWALANGITTGCNGGTGFCPTDPVTRGENITFAQRYDTNIVQPALAALQADAAAAQADAAAAQADADAAQADADANATNIATVASDLANSTRVYFARVGADGTVEKTSPQALTVVKDSTGIYIVTLPENAANCTVESSLHAQTEGFGLLIGLGYLTDAYTFAVHNTAGESDEVRVSTVWRDGIDADEYADYFDLPFSVTAYCSDPVYTVIPGIVIPPIFVFP